MTAIPVAIIGAGGFGREVHDVIEAVNDAGGQDGQLFEPVGFLDDGPADETLIAERGLRLLGGVEKLDRLAVDVQYIIAIGSGEVRRKIDTWARSVGRLSPVLVHPAATLGKHLVSLGPGLSSVPVLLSRRTFDSDGMSTSTSASLSGTMPCFKIM